MKPNKITQLIHGMSNNRDVSYRVRRASPLPTYLFMTVILLFLVTYRVSAQAEDLLSAVENETTFRNTVIPYNDPITLANRFYGIEAPPAPTEITPLSIGDRQEFWASDNSSGSTRQLNATLEAIGQYAYFWVENGQDVERSDLQDLADAFDTEIYYQVRDIWGSEPYFGVDGDPKLHILFARGLGASTAAYFSRRHNYPEIIMTHSNAREMFFVNLSTTPDVNSAFLRSTLAHEFQHMIRSRVKPNEDSWLNEGFSTFTEGYLGYEAARRYPNEFLREPETQLTTFGLAKNRLAEYGAGFLFVTYLYDQYGMDAIQALSERALSDNSTMSGIFAVGDVASSFGGMDESGFFADWAVANLIQNRSISPFRYGYNSLTQLIPPSVRQLNGRSATIERQLGQYATHYYELADFSGGDTISMSLDIPRIAPLIPVSPTSGEKFWYSNRGDVIHTRLYQTFDLTGVTTATLTYQIWTELEEQWDYGYVFISADGGESWQTLQTDYMTTENQLGNLYGDAGYSFLSGGWIKEQLILDEFVGGEVIISFELVTDDAINFAGMALDDVAIPEIGYYSDFETDNGGWVSEGWVWITNEIVQLAALQVVQRLPDEIQRDVIYSPSQRSEAIISEQIDPQAEAVWIIISPLAPITTIPTDYTLEIELTSP